MAHNTMVASIYGVIPCKKGEKTHVCIGLATLCKPGRNTTPDRSVGEAALWRRGVQPLGEPRRVAAEGGRAGIGWMGESRG